LAATLVEAARLGTEITVAHCEPDALPISGVSLVPLPAANGRLFTQAVAGLVAELNPDLIHLQYQPSMYGRATSICLLPGYLKRHGVKQPIITTFHDLNLPTVFPKLKPVRPWFLRQLVNKSDWYVITNSLDRRTGIDRFGLKQDRVVSIPIGSNFSAPQHSPEGHTGFRAGYFGLVTQDKGLEAALQAVAMVAQEGVDISFRVIGAWAVPDYVDDLRVAAERLGIATRVTFTGNIPGDAAATELWLLDACLLLYDEGVSTRRTSFASAMACGVPTITTMANLMPDGLENGRNCFAVSRPVQAIEVEAVLARLAKSAELRQSLGADARRWAEPLSYTHIGAQHADLYRRVACGKAHCATTGR
jgi:glycosyltransferase involved in cell wall biosynthesis